MKKHDKRISEEVKRKKRSRVCTEAVIISLFIIYLIIGLCKNGLQTTHYVYRSSKLPKSFDGYKIVVISDLHQKKFGNHQKELLEQIKKQQPDIIVLTGDLVDHNHQKMESITDFIRGASGIAPVYFVSGNHECDRRAAYQYEYLRELMNQYGVKELNYDVCEIKKENEVIRLTGIPYCGKRISERLFYADESYFNILLYHCSDAFDVISSFGYDIVLSGHTHGGIIRLPFVGGLLGNNRSFFPKYAGGVFCKNQSTLFSSRGLGDATIPRFYNPPEIVVITLQCA